MWKSFLNKIFVSLILLELVNTACHGQVVECEQHEYTSAIAIINPKKLADSCSGVLISAKHALTVKRCIEINSDWKRLKVVAGLRVIRPGAAYTQESRNIKKVLNHPMYTSQITFLKKKSYEPGPKNWPHGSFPNLKILFENFSFWAPPSLALSFTLSESVRPIPFKVGGYDASVCTLVGWRLSKKEKGNKIKRKQPIQLVKCPSRQLWGDDPDLCGSLLKERVDNCVGDIGSPIYCGLDLQAFLVGGACRTPGHVILSLNMSRYQKDIREYNEKHFVTRFDFLK